MTTAAATAAALYGRDLFGDIIQPAQRCKMGAQFGQPPFTTLSARVGDWQERKRAWIALGIRSELGRGAGLIPAAGKAAYGGNGFAGNRSGSREDDGAQNGAHKGGAAVYNSESLKRLGVDRNGSRANATPGGSAMPAMDYRNGERGSGNGRALPLALDLDLYRSDEPLPAAANDAPANSSSIFDPVLCELMYSWFTCPGAQVIDPFAGGSVRGIVAAILGRAYWGCDLSMRQIEANREQAALICEADAQPQWQAGDSAACVPFAPHADFVFSCPPYGDLERYSDDPRDLSAMAFAEFELTYSRIIRAACERLRMDRFAAFVVGDFRDKAGYYRNFPSITIEAFESAGARLYNESHFVDGHRQPAGANGGAIQWFAQAWQGAPKRVGVLQRRSEARSAVRARRNLARWTI